MIRPDEEAMRDAAWDRAGRAAIRQAAATLGSVAWVDACTSMRDARAALNMALGTPPELVNPANGSQVMGSWYRR